MKDRYEVSIEDKKKVLLYVLDKTLDYCQNNNLCIYVGYGSMIGAVRHNGFIPWDDDIDLLMPRKDYNYFVNHFKSIDENISVHSIQNDNCYEFPFAKIYYEKIHLVEKHYKKDYSLSLNIDVFPLDCLPDNFFQRNLIYSKVFILKTLYDLKCTAYKTDRNVIKKIVLSIGNLIFSKIPIVLICQIIENSLLSLPICSKTIGCYVDPYGISSFLPKEKYIGTIMCKFENLSVPIPSGYNDILKALYGDYLSFPPINEQISHHHNFVYSNEKLDMSLYDLT